MARVFLFAGQGSQKVGMGTALVAECADCRQTFQSADDALGMSLSSIMAQGPEETLRRTEFTQPALLTLSVAQARHLMAESIIPDALAGHSLGQYSALVIAGSLDFQYAVRCVRMRGHLMQETVPEGVGSMYAVIGLERERVYAACKRASAVGIVNVAAHNMPDQTVISGEKAAVEAAAAECERDDGSGVPLNVSVPFHCKLLEPMLPAFSRVIDALPISDPRIPVIDNVTAQALVTASDVRRSLVQQITAPVLFEESLRNLDAQGMNDFIQCGLGKSLLTFAQRTVNGGRFATFEQASLIGVAG